MFWFFSMEFFIYRAFTLARNTRVKEVIIDLHQGKSLLDIGNDHEEYKFFQIKKGILHIGLIFYLKKMYCRQSHFNVLILWGCSHVFLAYLFLKITFYCCNISQSKRLDYQLLELFRLLKH